MSGPTDPAEAHFDKGSWGWDLTQWRKLGLLWGYTDRLAERAFDLDAAAGSNTLSLGAVPSGEVWSVSLLTAVDWTSAVTGITVQLFVGADDYYLGLRGVTAAAVSVEIQGPIIAKTGDILRVNMGGCTLHDVLAFYVNGYKMAVGQ